VTPIVLAHTSDLHFGRDVQLDQIEALEALIQALSPDAVVVSGDLTQRARHGELQRAKVSLDRLSRAAPTLVVPGNHDVQWWASPLSIFGAAPKYAKYLHYFGPELTPCLQIDGAVIAGALTAHGVALGSLTWNPNDIAVKGHLPAAEAERLTRCFQSAPRGALRVAVMHHNVLEGEISRRRGLAHWRKSHRMLVATGADLVLCGHDHQESSGQIDGRVVVCTAGTHTDRCRGNRASAFNLITVDETSISVQHLRWEQEQRQFKASDMSRYGRIQHQ
jgi:3',5'-cyclic AMP phosphodiesterase CpdA